MAEASGKLILLGEHAVVYGAPAIAAGLSRGASARAVRAPAPSLRIGDRSAEEGDGSALASGLAAVLRELDVGAYQIDVDLALPPGAGLGASAAIGVAIARAVLEASGCESDTGRVLAAAAAWEGVFHGTASGIDAAAAALGGCFRYTRTGGAAPLMVQRALTLVVVLTGPAESTRVMVEGVRRLRERRPEIVDKAVDGITSLVNNAELCLASGDLPALGKLMDFNQMILSGLFVSTENIERVCALAREAGALGAKLTGGGGGGAVIALSDGDPAALLATFEREGLPCFPTTIEATGAA